MVLQALRSMNEHAHKREPEFRKAAEEFLKHAQEAINPSLTEADVREMLIQHILTKMFSPPCFRVRSQRQNYCRFLGRSTEKFLFLRIPKTGDHCQATAPCC